MTAAAPTFRSVCQLTGDKQPPTKFFDALAATDASRQDEAAELERLRDENAELHIRVLELGGAP